MLPTGKAEDPLNFLDVGTGNKRYEVHGGLTADLGYHRIGARLIGNYQRRFSSDRALRVTPPDQPIPFANRSSRVTLDPGDLYSLSAQPFFRLAPQLAIMAGVSYWHEAEGSASYVASSDVISGVSAGAPRPGIRPQRHHVHRRSHVCGSRGARVPERQVRPPDRCNADL